MRDKKLFLPSVFFGLQVLVLFSLTQNGLKSGPNCADDVPVRRVRARARLVQKHHQHNWDPILA